MDLERLNRSPVGELVPITGHDARHGDFAYFAYLPRPLPDDIDLASSTWTKVAQASNALGRVDQVCAQLPDPSLIIRPALFREALDTSALEGTVGVLRDLLEAQLPNPHYMSSETVEINAYVAAAMMAFDMIGEREISVGFLSELQARLFRDKEDKPQDIGRPRRNQVWIGDKNRPIQEARFVPPPPDDRLQAGLDSWQNWVQSKHENLDPLVRASMAHYQLESLHPFGDGNGRIGRLTVILQLLKSGVIKQPAITLSPWLLKNRAQYQEGLLAVSCTGNWNPWVTLLCEAVTAQCGSLIIGAQRLIDWLAESRRKLDARRWTGVIHRVLDGLIEWPVTSASSIAERYKIASPSANSIIGHLVEEDILTELTGRSYGRSFGALEVMQIVDDI